MSSTTIRFRTTLIVGEQELPLFSELAIGQGNSQDGVSKGFIFRLDRQPFDPPFTLYLGDILNFITQKLNSVIDTNSQQAQLVYKAFPGLNAGNFNGSNQTLINIYEFSLNSSDKETLFAFNMDMQGSDPNQGLIPLPEAFSSWLNIESISLSLSVTSKQS